MKTWKIFAGIFPVVTAAIGWFGFKGALDTFEVVAVLALAIALACMCATGENLWRDRQQHAKSSPTLGMNLVLGIVIFVLCGFYLFDHYTRMTNMAALGRELTNETNLCQTVQQQLNTEQTNVIKLNNDVAALQRDEVLFINDFTQCFTWMTSITNNSDMLAALKKNKTQTDGIWDSWFWTIKYCSMHYDAACKISAENTPLDQGYPGPKMTSSRRTSGAN